jgi:hypothetical protein
MYILPLLLTYQDWTQSYEILLSTSLKMSIVVFWVVTPCSLVSEEFSASIFSVSITKEGEFIFCHKMVAYLIFYNIILTTHNEGNQ